MPSIITVPLLLCALCHLLQLQTAVEIAKAADKKPLSMAFSEIARGDVSYDPETIDAENH